MILLIKIILEYDAVGEDEENYSESTNVFLHTWAILKGKSKCYGLVNTTDV